MRTYDLSPLYRTTVGFDRLAQVLDSVMSNDGGSQSYPPYNIEKTGDDAYRITVAVAGFTDDELTIEARDGQLVIAGKKAADEDKPTYEPIATAARSEPYADWDRSYEQHFMSFEMSDHFPIWIEVETDYSDDYLRRFI